MAAAPAPEQAMASASPTDTTAAPPGIPQPLAASEALSDPVLLQETLIGPGLYLRSYEGEIFMLCSPEDKQHVTKMMYDSLLSTHHQKQQSQMSLASSTKTEDEEPPS